MAIIKCPECGHQVSDWAKTCPSCGIEIEGKIMTCSECGEIVFKNQEMCPNCHHSFYEDVESSNHYSSVSSEKDANTFKTETDTIRNNVHYGKGKTKNGTLFTVLTVAFVIALVVVFGGVYFYKNIQQQNEKDAYENAMTSTEPAVLQSYLDMYTMAPDEHRDSVFARLDTMKRMDAEWINAVLNGSKVAFEKYIQMHPNSIHNIEATIKIDSLDWLSAMTVNTPESYQAYIDDHGDGLYVDDARSKLDKLNAQKITPEDKQIVNKLFLGFFTSLAANDEDGLTENIANIMGSFLHKSDATKSDVISYMKKLHENADTEKMNFRLNNDWEITKTEIVDGSYEYSVSFSVDRKIENLDPNLNRFDTYKVDAKVSSDGKISDLNMKKVV